MPETITILITEFNGGGVSRMMVNLANGLAQLEQSIDLITKAGPLPFIDKLDKRVKHISFATNQSAETLQQKLADYLKKKQPKVLLSAMLKDHQLALNTIQNAKLSHRPRLFFRSGTNYAEEVKRTFITRRAKRRQAIRNAYLGADECIAVSQGVAEGLAEVCDIVPQKIHVLKNPTVTGNLLKQAEQAFDHPWFKQHDLPVIVSTGDLSRRKNFELLIDAITLVNHSQSCRLVIIGGGKRQARLEKRAKKSGIQNMVQFLGFCENPYPYMKQADLTVLSSNREGSPNVLVESLAVGTPVVSTDCPSGPMEILKNGRYGILVPMKSPEKLAEGILKMLQSPTSAELLQQASAPYQQKQSALSYLQAFGMTDNLPVTSNH